MSNLLESYRLCEPLTLVVDPSVAGYGYCLFDQNGELSRYGILTADKTHDISIISSLQQGLNDLFNLYTITEIIAETPIGTRSYNACKALWMVYPIAIMTANQMQVKYTAIKANVPKNSFGIRYKDDVLVWCEENGIKIEGNKRMKETAADCCLIYHCACANEIVEQDDDLAEALEFLEKVLDESDDNF